MKTLREICELAAHSTVATTEEEVGAAMDAANARLELQRRLSPATMLIVLEALEESQNALKDYIADAEKRGSKMYYGHSVIKRNDLALAALNNPTP